MLKRMLKKTGTLFITFMLMMSLIPHNIAYAESDSTADQTTAATVTDAAYKKVIFDAGDGYFKNSDGTSIIHSIKIVDNNDDGKVKVKYPFAVNDSKYTAVRSGFTLVGWKSGDKTIAADKLDKHEFRIKKNTTYTAVWEGKPYYVTLQTPEGKNIGSARQMILGDDNDLCLDALQLTLKDVSPNGAFTGWEYVKSDGKKVFFDGLGNTVHSLLDSTGEPIFETESVKLKAVTTKYASVDITYDSNGGTGKMAKTTLTYGILGKLSGNAFTKEDSIFIGWSTDPEATSPQFTNEQETACNFGFPNDTKLYAVWMSEKSTSTETYQAVFLQNHIAISSGYPTYENHAATNLSKTAVQFFDGSTSAISTATPYQQGFYLTGFRLAKQDGKHNITKKSAAYNPESTFAINDDKILITTPTGQSAELLSDYVSDEKIIYIYPEFAPVTVKMAYSSNEGSGKDPEDCVITLGQTTRLAENKYKHSTKSFVGWSLDPAATGENMYVDGTAEDTAVYPVDFYIRSVVNSNQGYELFSDPFSKYLDIKKWSKEIDPDTNFDSGTGLLDLTDVIPINAIWAEETYTVHFDSNPGLGNTGLISGTMEDQVIQCNTKTQLTANAFALSGYKFEGWNTRANGKGTSYADGATVSKLAKNNETVTLYAQWSQSLTIRVPLVVKQTWDDQADQDGLRPQKVKYTISAKAGSRTLTTTELGLVSQSYEATASSSEVTIAQVPQKVQINGKNIKVDYTVTAATIDKYTSSVSYSSTDSNIKASYTFEHTPETKNYTVTIKMSDSNNQDGSRPSTISITLTGNDGTSMTTSVNITGETTTHTFENLPVYKNGKKITYTVKASNASGYTFTTSTTESSATVTGTHTPAMQTVVIRAQWQDDNNAAKIRPTSLSATYMSPSGTTQQVLLSEPAWTASLANIPKTQNSSGGSITVPNVEGYTSNVTGSTVGGYTIVMNLTEAAKKLAEEEAAAAAAASEAEEEEERAQQQEEAEDQKPERVIDIKVRTIWNDSGQDYLRPITMAIELIGSDGQRYERALTNTESFETVFRDIPEVDAITQKPLTYKLSYTPISGYTTHVYHNRKNANEFIIENFMPTNQNEKDALLQSTYEDGTPGGMVSIPNKKKTITIGGHTDEPDELEVNEDGTLRVPDLDGEFETQKETSVVRIGTVIKEFFTDFSPASLKRFIIPGAILLGIIAIISAIIMFVRSRK